MNDAVARRLFKYNGVFKEVKDLDESPDLKLDEIFAKIRMYVDLKIKPRINENSTLVENVEKLIDKTKKELEIKLKNLIDETDKKYLEVLIPHEGLKISLFAFKLIPPYQVLLPNSCNFFCDSLESKYDCNLLNCSNLYWSWSIYAKGESFIATPSTGYNKYKGSLLFETNSLLIFIKDDSLAITAS